MKHSKGTSNLISFFVRHKTACNLLMLVLMMLGGAAAFKLNTQLMPTIQINAINITVNWAGASAEDVEQSIIALIEPNVKYIDNLSSMRSVAVEGRASIKLRFEPNTNMGGMQDVVIQAVAGVSGLPVESDLPVITNAQHYETVSQLAVYGDFDEKSLKYFALKIRDGLLNSGIEKIDFIGKRNQEIDISFSPELLERLDVSLDQISNIISQKTSTKSSGNLKTSVEKKLRSFGAGKNLNELGEIEVLNIQSHSQVLIKDIATIKTGFDENQTIGQIDGQPAIVLLVKRSAGSDTIDIMDRLQKYLDKIENIFPPNLKVIKIQENGEYVRDRLNLLLENGLSGIALVMLILFLFLNARIALWVAMGIPVAILTTLLIMYFFDTEISMISMFALLMMLGIIVDDAIVVAEETETLMQQGMLAIDAAEQAAKTMLKPVLAASLTTIAAFMPLAIVQGVIGQILIIFPIIVISVLVASLVECFLILPGHLRHVKPLNQNVNWFRRGFDKGFLFVKDKLFLPFAIFTYKLRWVTLSLSLGALLVSIGYITSERLGLEFFPQSESEQLITRIEFAPGTKTDVMQRDFKLIENALWASEASFFVPKNTLVKTIYNRIGGEDAPEVIIQVGLTRSELRSVRTQEIIDKWIELSPQLPSVDRLVIQGSKTADDESSAISFRLSGPSLDVLKLAAADLVKEISKVPGISGADDDYPLGKRELIIKTNAKGNLLGFNSSLLSKQLKDHYEGVIALSIPSAEGDVNIVLNKNNQTDNLGNLYNFRAKSPQGYYIPLQEIATIQEQRGAARIRKRDGQTNIAVTADVDDAVIAADTARRLVKQQILPKILARYGIQYKDGGKGEEQAAAMQNLLVGVAIAMAMVYIILAWVFASYIRPIVVMFIIPFGIIGMVVGHMSLGFNLSILSLFGFLGLSGILVNDSIILVTKVDEHLENGLNVFNAAILGAYDRFRAVLLTSMTTIAGLTPLLFEQSLQAKFLQPLAITLVFGLAFATLLVLVLIPALIGCMDDISRWVKFGTSDFYERNNAKDNVSKVQL